MPVFKVLKKYNMIMYPRNLFVFSLLQGLLWSLAALGYFYNNGFYTDPWGLVFTLVFIPGQMFLFAWALALICFPCKWLGPRVLQIACIVIGSLFSFFLAADMVVFAQYRFHIGVSLLELFFGPAGREIFIFSTGMWGLIALIAVSILGLEVALTVLSKKISVSIKTALVILGIWVVCFGMYNGIYAWGKFKMIPSVAAQQSVLPFAYPLSANRRLAKWGFIPSQTPYQFSYKGALNYPLHPLVCTAEKPTKNILIILVDSWRGDMLNPTVMPRLSAWLKLPGMHVFTNHLSGGNSTMGECFRYFMHFRTPTGTI